MKGFIAITVLAALAGSAFIGCGEEERNLKRRIVYHPSSKSISKSIQREWTVDVKPNGDTLLHGAVKDYYWGGANRKSVVWVDGVRHGSSQAWYDNGGQQWQKNFIKGERDGTWRLFYSDANPWMVVEYKNGKLEGTVKKWSRTEPNQPEEAVFSAGLCKSGNCNILDLPEATEEVSTADRNQISRDRDILVDFLD
jgi:hypothetical protein